MKSLKAILEFDHIISNITVNAMLIDFEKNFTQINKKYSYIASVNVSNIQIEISPGMVFLIVLKLRYGV